MSVSTGLPVLLPLRGGSKVIERFKKAWIEECRIMPSDLITMAMGAFWFVLGLCVGLMI